MKDQDRTSSPLSQPAGHADAVGDNLPKLPQKNLLMPTPKNVPPLKAQNRS